MSTTSIDAALARLMEMFDVRTRRELAQHLKTSESAVTDCLRRGELPHQWLLAALYQKGANPQWIEFGIGCQYLEPSNDNPFFIAAVDDRDLCPTEDLIAELCRRLPGYDIRITSPMGVTI